MKVFLHAGQLERFLEKRLFLCNRSINSTCAMFKLISCEERAREREREREREKRKEDENEKSHREQIHFPWFSEASECQQSNYKHERIVNKRIQVSTQMVHLTGQLRREKSENEKDTSFAREDEKMLRRETKMK